MDAEHRKCSRTDRGMRCRGWASAESGLPGPTIDARGALLYIATPALSPSLPFPVLWSLRRLGCIIEPATSLMCSLYPRPYLSVWSTEPSTACATGSPTGMDTWRTSRNIILAWTRIHFHGVLSRRPFVRHRVSHRIEISGIRVNCDWTYHSSVWIYKEFKILKIYLRGRKWRKARYKIEEVERFYVGKN